jgi:hypothetical protein
MATIEERVQALEQEHAELKKALELQTVAIGALVSKTTLEKLIEQDDKLFDTLIAHDRLTNERLGHLQTQVIEVDGKITGLQVETRQGFTELDGKIVGLQTEMRQRFDAVNNRFEDLEQGMNSRFDQITLLLNALGSQPEQEK